MNGFKKVVLTMSLAAMAAALPAHAKGGGGGGIGLKGGVGMGKVGSTATAGLGFGGGLSFKSGGQIGIMIDALYMMRKMKDAGVEAKFNQLYVPVQAVFHVGPSFSITGGGYLSYGIGDLTLSASEGGVSYSVPATYKEMGLKQMDYGLVGGVGIMISRVSIEARYNFGLANLNDVAGGTSAKYTGFDVLLGFMF